MNEQRPELKIQINDVIIEGLLHTGTDVSIISPESQHPSWPLQEVNVQFLGIVFYPGKTECKMAQKDREGY